MLFLQNLRYKNLENITVGDFIISTLVINVTTTNVMDLRFCFFQEMIVVHFLGVNRNAFIAS